LAHVLANQIEVAIIHTAGRASGIFNGSTLPKKRHAIFTGGGLGNALRDLEGGCVEVRR
jgi:hypothetical protein